MRADFQNSLGRQKQAFIKDAERRFAKINANTSAEHKKALKRVRDEAVQEMEDRFKTAGVGDDIEMGGDPAREDEYEELLGHMETARDAHGREKQQLQRQLGAAAREKQHLQKQDRVFLPHLLFPDIHCLQKQQFYLQDQ